MQILFQGQDEQLQVPWEIQNLIDDWTDAREAPLAWDEYELTGVEGTLSYDEYSEKPLGPWVFVWDPDGSSCQT